MSSDRGTFKGANTLQIESDDNPTSTWSGGTFVLGGNPQATDDNDDTKPESENRRRVILNAVLTRLSKEEEQDVEECSHTHTNAHSFK